ncbi:hypothetical protein [Lysinibacillus fusiformis]|uniref:hypothetical protein n=1 Tax=Lysinibacillus fusiformis TaxID=28031 RepID=UPI00263B82AE|nr:hypothetical protein [Lysinibacillus fusiformis]MDC6267738.1 hypothetical protein [Lysinibacillus sphaericus]MDN4967772.1 hypothetical protein [Lysinibacillus fusiformis]MDN4967828.1 hypothetical protein [Lysinibacillus fusiformis]
MLSSEDKVELLNSMEIIETDGDGETLYYVLVDYNEENLEKLAQIVPNLEQYLKDFGDVDNDKSAIEISMAAWEYTEATWFQSGKFHKEIDYARLKSELATDENKDWCFDQVKKSAEKYGLNVSEEDFKRFFKLQVGHKDIDWMMRHMAAYKKTLIDTLVTYITY